MSGANVIDLALGVLDHQLVDRDGRRCGKVDDLELGGLDGAEPHLAGILVGAAALSRRGRLGALAARRARGPAVAVPWSAVADVEAGLRLAAPADELGLAREGRANAIVSRVPGARL